MIEIIPNWHPIFVHFTASLFSISVLFSIFSYFINHVTWIPQNTARELNILNRAFNYTSFTVIDGLERRRTRISLWSRCDVFA
jgi:hypothetical protein